MAAAFSRDRRDSVGRGRIRVERWGRVTVRIFILSVACGGCVIDRRSHDVVRSGRARPGKRRQGQERQVGEQACRDAEETGLQPNTSIERDRNGDQVLHHRGHWRACPLGNRRSTKRKPIFHDIVRTGNGGNSAARLRNRHGGVCAASLFQEFHGKHRDRQRRHRRHRER
jgi:hypothetical protein